MLFVRLRYSCCWTLAYEQAGVKQPHACAGNVNLNSTSLSVHRWTGLHAPAVAYNRAEPEQALFSRAQVDQEAHRVTCSTVAKHHIRKCCHPDGCESLRHVCA
jgi:hypothetical protein